jgi:hypothetical protein
LRPGGLAEVAVLITVGFLRHLIYQVLKIFQLVLVVQQEFRAQPVQRVETVV